MLLEAAGERNITLPQSWMIGDRWRDIGAGKTAGCRTILVEQDYAERKAEAPDFVVESLAEAVDVILRCSASVRPGM